jgi:hypothetical protein
MPVFIVQVGMGFLIGLIAQHFHEAPETDFENQRRYKELVYRIVAFLAGSVLVLLGIAWFLTYPDWLVLLVGAGMSGSIAMLYVLPIYDRARPSVMLSFL